MTRVLTLIEILGYDGAVLIEYNPTRISHDMAWAFFDYMNDRYVHLYLKGGASLVQYAKSSYGVTWRCWTARPTESDRAAELWKT